MRYTLSERDRIGAGFQRDRRGAARAATMQSASIQTTEFTLERDGALIRRRRRAVACWDASPPPRSTSARPCATPSPRTAHRRAVDALLEIHRPLRRHTGLSLTELSGSRALQLAEGAARLRALPGGGARLLRGQDEQAFFVDRYGLSRLEWRRFLGDGSRARIPVLGLRPDGHTFRALPDGGFAMDVEQRHGIGFGLRLDAAGGTVGGRLRPRARPSAARGQDPSAG